MRLLKAFFLTTLLLAVASPMPENSQLMGQTEVSINRADGSTLVKLPTIAIDTTGYTKSTITSTWFSITKYDGNSFYTYPISYTKKLAAANGKPRVTTTIEASNDQSTVFVVDTAGIVADSVVTSQSGTLNFNNKKFLYYRIKHVGETLNRNGVTGYFDLFFTKPDVIN